MSALVVLADVRSLALRLPKACARFQSFPLAPKAAEKGVFPILERMLGEQPALRISTISFLKVWDIWSYDSPLTSILPKMVSKGK